MSNTLKQAIINAEVSINDAISLLGNQLEHLKVTTDSTFNDLFQLVEAKPEPVTVKRQLGPIPFDDLRAGDIEIPYSGRQQSGKWKFMDFSPKHRRWLDIFITDLRIIGMGSQADMIIMDSTAKAHRGTYKSQTWFDFITELHTDKVVAKWDFSEAQMFRLVELIDALRGGSKLAGCGKLSFKDTNTGNTF